MRRAGITRALLLLFAAACGPAALGSRPPSKERSAKAFVDCLVKTQESCADVAPREATCPSSPEAAKVAMACGWSDETNPTTCAFGTTTCRCEPWHGCGGAPPPPRVEHAMLWVCREALRPDDCPRDEEEAAHGTCTTEAKTCSFISCPRRHTCTCRGGHWSCTSDVFAPP